MLTNKPGSDCTALWREVWNNSDLFSPCCSMGEASHPSMRRGLREVSAPSYFKKKSLIKSLFASSPSLKACRPLSLLSAWSPPFSGLWFLFLSFLYSNYCSFLYGEGDTSSAHLPQLSIRLTRLPPAYCLALLGLFNEVLKRFPWADLTSWPSLPDTGHCCWSDRNCELLAAIWLQTISLDIQWSDCFPLVKELVDFHCPHLAVLLSIII